jgi:hypothetical protein
VQGDEWTLPGVLDAVRSGRSELEARTSAGAVPLELALTAREREILLAGGLVAHAARA